MAGMDTFRVLDIAGSGLAAERRRMEVIAANIANAQTLRTEDGGPYRRREALFESVLDGFGGDGLPEVRVAEIAKDPTPFRRVYLPGHPFADEEGFVAMPNVDLVFEMVDLMAAVRSYESNLKSIQAFRRMADAALEIGRA